MNSRTYNLSFDLPLNKQFILLKRKINNMVTHCSLRTFDIKTGNLCFSVGQFTRNAKLLGFIDMYIENTEMPFQTMKSYLWLHKICNI